MATCKRLRPYNALASIRVRDFRGESKYDSLQMTLSRQTSRNLQYFVAYTYGKTRGTLADEYDVIDPYDPKRTYGVLNQDRTHVLNVSWNAFLPDGARGAMDNPIGRGLLNGWQISGISSLASGIPYRLSFSGAAAAGSISAAYFGTADVVGPAPSLAVTASRLSTRAIRPSAARMPARRFSTSTASGCRHSARMAS